jgi:hypothetical protein
MMAVANFMVHLAVQGYWISRFTCVSPNWKWLKVFKPLLQKEKRLGIDRRGRDADPELEASIYSPVNKHFREVVPEKFHNAVYPWAIEGYVNRVLREMLLSQYLTHEFAKLFKDMSFEELEEMAASFKFEKVEKRAILNKHLSKC